MIGALLLGAGTGVGLWSLAVWAVPPRRPLRQVLAQLTPPVPAPSLPEARAEGWTGRIGRPFTTALRGLGLPGARLRRDLAITARDADTHLARKAAFAVLGLLAPPVAAGLLAAAGAPTGVAMPALGALLLAAVGFLLPDVQLHAEATRRRHDFRHALSAYLDLVVITLAGGAGVDGALTDAARIGRGWAFTQLRRTLDGAQLTRTTPWAALRQLGADLDIPELGELAASASLAGTEGARLRASLATRAQTLRTHLLTDTDAAARAATERMALPWGLLFLGFLTFIGYPAVHLALTSL